MTASDQAYQRGQYDVGSEPPPEWAGMVRWGGLFMLAAGAIVLIFIGAVLISQLTLPLPATETLEDPAFPAALFVLAAFGELMLLPAALGLYFALRDADRTAMAIATALWVLAVPLFLGSRALILAVAKLGSSYTEATSEATRSAYVASADLALAAEDVFATLALVALGLAAIIAGVVMLRERVGWRIGYVVILASVLTLTRPFAEFVEIPIIVTFVGLVLTGVWQVTVGVKLFMLGAEQPMPLRHSLQPHG